MTRVPESDSELLTRFHRGDVQALSSLYLRYEQPIYSFLLGMLRRPADAEDALQETFILALRKSGAVAGESLRGWLFAVAHRQALLAKRKAARRPETADESLLAQCFGECDPADAADRSEQAALLRNMLAELPPAQEAVIRLRIFEGLRFREVAEKLNCPLNTALARMHDGLKKLRLLWEARYATAG